MTITRRQFAGLTLATAAAASVGATASLAGAAKSRTGSLSGRKGYNVSGSVEVTTVDGKTKVILGEDYVFDPSKNPPDIKIGFGSGEQYAKGSKIHDELTVKAGAASFEVPEGIDVTNYDELYIYCEQFTVILAVAPLN